MFEIYVACLAAYNEGMLHGKWIKCDWKSADELREEIEEVLKSSPVLNAEEWAIHDYMGFGSYKLSENPDLEELAEHVKVFNDNSKNYDAELISGVCDWLNVSASDALEYIQNNYHGEYDSLEAWAENILEESGELRDMPKRLQFYFDYKAYARDCELSGDIFTIESDSGIYVLWNN